MNVEIRTLNSKQLLILHHLCKSDLCTAQKQTKCMRNGFAGDKTDYLTTTADPNNPADYLNKVHWDWADFSTHFNGRTDDVDDSAHKVWDYGHTDVQYADPVKNSITNPIASSSQIGGVGEVGNGNSRKA